VTAPPERPRTHHPVDPTADDRDSHRLYATT
jgi:hypothetical protein